MKNTFSNKGKSGINPIVAGIAGVAVGVGITAALKDKKTKEKLEQAVGDIKSRVSDYMEEKSVAPKAKREVKKVGKTLKTAAKKSTN